MNKLMLVSIVVGVGSLTGCQESAGASAARGACAGMAWLASTDAATASPGLIKGYADDVVSKLLEASQADPRYNDLARAGMIAMQRVEQDGFTPQLYDAPSYAVLTELADTQCNALGVGKH